TNISKPTFFDNVPHIELRAKREVTPPFDMSTAYRQTNFRDRPEYALSPRVAAETPNGVPGRPMNPILAATAVILAPQPTGGRPYLDIFFPCSPSALTPPCAGIKLPAE